MTTKPSAGELALEAVQIIEALHLKTFGTDRVNAIRELAARSVPFAPQVATGEREAIPRELTGEIACILEDCSPPDKQTPEAVAALIEGYQPTWDRILAALASQQRSEERAKNNELADRLEDRAETHDKQCFGSPMGLGYYSGNDARLMRDAADILRSTPRRSLTGFLTL
jgi:hypothetical protein